MLHADIVCGSSDEILEAVYVGIVACVADYKRLWGIDDACVICQPFVFAGFVCDFDGNGIQFAADFMVYLLEKKHVVYFF